MVLLADVEFDNIASHVETDYLFLRNISIKYCPILIMNVNENWIHNVGFWLEENFRKPR